MTYQITLNDNEQDFCTRQAQRRTAYHIKKGTPDTKVGPQSQAETDLQGVAGEMIVAKAYNVFPDFSDVPGTYDLVLGSHKIEVKTTRHEDGHLQLDVTKCRANAGDVYVLVIGTFPKLRIAGWAWSEEFINDSTKDFDPRTKITNYRIHNSKLRPWDTLR